MNHEAEAERDWCVVVGGAQRMLPSWVILTMCATGGSSLSGWSARFFSSLGSQAVKRDSAHLRWWFDYEYNGGKLGSAWACVRGSYLTGGRVTTLTGRGDNRPCMAMLDDDSRTLRYCEPNRLGVLPELNSLHKNAESSCIKFRL